MPEGRLQDEHAIVVGGVFLPVPNVAHEALPEQERRVVGGLYFSPSCWAMKSSQGSHGASTQWSVSASYVRYPATTISASVARAIASCASLASGSSQSSE